MVCLSSPSHILSQAGASCFSPRPSETFHTWSALGAMALPKHGRGGQNTPSVLAFGG